MIISFFTKLLKCICDVSDIDSDINEATNSLSGFDNLGSDDPIESYDKLKNEERNNGSRDD